MKGARRGGCLTFLAIVVLWEVAAHLVGPGQFADTPLIPSFEYILGPALKGLSDHWTIEALAPVPSLGGEQTYLGAFLAILYHSGLTLLRLLLGLIVGLVLGIGLGLAVAYWIAFGQAAWTPLNFLRMVPLLAAIPLFQFWFGANTLGSTVFIAYGVAVLLIVATIVAVRNVPDRYIESARTLGASRITTYRTVVIPATLPELRTSLLLAAGLSWSLVIGSEYLGLTDGLGRILVTAEYFTNTGRMIIVAILVVIYSILTFGVLDRVAQRALVWVPRLEQSSQVDKAALAAGGLALGPPPSPGATAGAGGSG